MVRKFKPGPGRCNDRRSQVAKDHRKDRHNWRYLAMISEPEISDSVRVGETAAVRTAWEPENPVFEPFQNQSHGHGWGRAQRRSSGILGTFAGIGIHAERDQPGGRTILLTSRPPSAISPPTSGLLFPLLGAIFVPTHDPVMPERDPAVQRDLSCGTTPQFRPSSLGFGSPSYQIQHYKTVSPRLINTGVLVRIPFHL